MSMHKKERPMRYDTYRPLHFRQKCLKQARVRLHFRRSSIAPHKILTIISSLTMENIIAIVSIDVVVALVGWRREAKLEATTHANRKLHATHVYLPAQNLYRHIVAHHELPLC